MNSDERRGGSLLAGCKAVLRFEERALRHSGEPVHSSVYVADSKPEKPAELFENPMEVEHRRVGDDFNAAGCAVKYGRLACHCPVNRLGDYIGETVTTALE